MVRILLVTDDADLSNMLRVYLHHQGYEITHVTNYTSALNIVRDTSVQMVLYEVMENSDISNFEFVKTLGTSIPKIEMIAFNKRMIDEWDPPLWRRDNNLSYLSIPFDIVYLHELIEDGLKRFY